MHHGGKEELVVDQPGHALAALVELNLHGILIQVRHNTTTMTLTASRGANESWSQSLTWPMSLMHDAIRDLLCEEKGTTVTSPTRV